MVRKMLGRDLTPQKIAARVSRVVWVNALAEWLLEQKAAVHNGIVCLLTLTLPCGSGALFESTRILPEAECMA
jgi:hypothetical protein